jgi:hypothetical protein
MVVFSASLVVKGMPNMSNKVPIHVVVQNFYLDIGIAN